MGEQFMKNVTGNGQRSIHECNQKSNGEAYIRKILECFNMAKTKPIDTPVIKNHSLSLEYFLKALADKAKMDNALYESAIGSLIYAMVWTRPELAYVVGLLRCF